MFLQQLKEPTEFLMLLSLPASTTTQVGLRESATPFLKIDQVLEGGARCPGCSETQQFAEAAPGELRQMRKVAFQAGQAGGPHILGLSSTGSCVFTLAAPAPTACLTDPQCVERYACPCVCSPCLLQTGTRHKVCSDGSGVLSFSVSTSVDLTVYSPRPPSATCYL